MLKNIPLFSGLNEAEIAEIARHAVVRSYPKNTVLINEGDHSDTLYVIQEGKVKVYLADEQGKEIVLNQQNPKKKNNKHTQHNNTTQTTTKKTKKHNNNNKQTKKNNKNKHTKNPN